MDGEDIIIEKTAGDFVASDCNAASALIVVKSAFTVSSASSHIKHWNDLQVLYQMTDFVFIQHRWEHCPEIRYLFLCKDGVVNDHSLKLCKQMVTANSPQSIPLSCWGQCFLMMYHGFDVT